MHSYLFCLQLGIAGSGLIAANEQGAVHLNEGLHGCLPTSRLEEGVDGVKDPILSNKKHGQYQLFELSGEVLKIRCGIKDA